MVNFKAGFERAIEILSDKNDKLLCKLKDLESGLNSFKYQVTATYLHLDCNEIIKSLQQTEWQVKFDPNKKDDYGCLKLIKC